MKWYWKYKLHRLKQSRVYKKFPHKIYVEDFKSMTIIYVVSSLKVEEFWVFNDKQIYKRIKGIVTWREKHKNT